MALQKAMGTLPSDTESFLLHQYLSDCWGLQSFKSVVKNSLFLYLDYTISPTERVKTMACFSDGRNLKLPIAATCKICNTCTILRHNQSERIVRFRRTLRKPIRNAPPRLHSGKKTYELPKRNGKFFLAPTVG